MVYSACLRSSGPRGAHPAKHPFQRVCGKAHDGNIAETTAAANRRAHDPRASTDQTSEHWHQALLASMRDIVLVADIDGTFTYCSPAVESALGYRPSELTGTNERDLIHPSDLPVHDGLIGRLVASELPQPPIELRLHDRDGIVALVRDDIDRAARRSGRARHRDERPQRHRAARGGRGAHRPEPARLAHRVAEPGRVDGPA